MINWPPNSGGIFDLAKKQKRLEELALQAENPKLWEKPAEMQKLNKEKAFLEKQFIICAFFATATIFIRSAAFSVKKNIVLYDAPSFCPIVLLRE